MQSSGVHLTELGEACFGGLNRCAAISNDEPDFSMTYDRRNKAWTASWKWANGHSPSELSNSVQEYAVPCHARDAFKNEILQWQQNGWLLPYSELGPPKGLIPLMAVVQEQKQKVRPVLDYLELYGFVDAFTANAEVRAETKRVAVTRSQCVTSRPAECISSNPRWQGAVAISKSHF